MVMTAQREPSVEELRRESERSRAALTNTVVSLRDQVSDTAEDLKDRLSPANLKEEVKDYVREGSEEFFDSIKRKARENPLQAVAIGAGLAYPLWGLVKRMPIPIMLAGAGLWLSRQKAPSGGDHGYANGIARKLTEAGSEGANRISEAVEGATAAMSAGAESVTDKVRATAHDVTDSVSNMGRSAFDTVKDSAASVADSVSTTTSDMKNKVSEFGGQTKHSLVDLVDRNPLLVGGIGVAIGAFIAASLPPSEAENRMFGERSDDLKEKSMAAASQGVERAKDVAAGIVGDVAAAAARQGLNTDGLARAVEGVTEGVKSVMDKGLKTALGEATPTQSTNAPFNQTTADQRRPQ
jgi:ElaB/YqjD/DUF883 family membrane-anchored ribosome-binding protein